MIMVFKREDLKRFPIAGISCMTAGFVTNPIDVIKTRLQLQGELVRELKAEHVQYDGFFRGAMRISKEEGLKGLLKGAFPSVLREGIYGTLRIGAYEPLKEALGAEDPAHTPLWKKILAGAIAGSFANAVATPTDLVKVRMQVHGVPRYRNTWVALSSIARSEGIRGLWRGVGPTVKRAAIVTATQVPSYDHAKHTILNAGWMREGVGLHIVASMFAGFATAFTTSPVDVIKTRIMNQRSDPGHPRVYRNSWDCLIRTVSAEGLRGLYKGFVPNWMRIGPHTIISFLMFEQLRLVIGLKPM